MDVDTDADKVIKICKKSFAIKKTTSIKNIFQLLILTKFFCIYVLSEKL